MKILFLNGSPKGKNSTSEKLINGLRQRLGDSNEYSASIALGEDKAGLLEKITNFDTLIIVFPLYVDGLPSHLLRLLYEVKDEIRLAAPELMVYGVVNNGFYEGKQNCLALSMLSHFCTCANVKWRQGLGIGAGGMISSISTSIGSGPLKSIGLALDTFSKNIKEKAISKDFFIEPNFPKSLYKIAAHNRWRKQAKKSGVRRKEIYKQL